VHLFTHLLPPTTPHTTHPTTTSLGDTNKTTALHTLASTGKSLWTADLETELKEGRVDVIVHSMKDVPTLLPRGMRCVAVGGREEARDAVVMGSKGRGEGLKGLSDLPEGGVVGTSSVRRAAMIRRRRPGLVIKDVRGNIGTRLRKLDDVAEGFDALVLAGAGVQRLGMGGRITAWLGREEGVLHAVGQGAVGVEWREGDGWVEGLLGGMSGGRVGWEVEGERALLRALEGGCSVPVGVDCVWEELPQDETQQQEADGKAQGGMLTMHAMVVSLDGHRCVEASQRHRVGSDAEAEECAWRVYRELVDKGAEDILKGIRLNRGMIEGQDGA